MNHASETISSHLVSNPYANPFRAALAKGRPLVGVWSMLNSSNAIEGLGWAGFDWILIDGEHSPVSLGDALSHLRAIGCTPAIPITRLVWNDHVLLKQYLDIGAHTIMLPYVQSAAEAQAAVLATRYAPQGARGYAGMHRASRYGHIENYARRASEGLFLIVQVETTSALEKVDEIAAVPGIDAVFFGPGDLAASMGRLGGAADAEVTTAIDAARPRVKASGKVAGVLAPSADLARHYVESGFDFVSVATDCGLLFSQADRVASTYRDMARQG